MNEVNTLDMKKKFKRKKNTMSKLENEVVIDELVKDIQTEITEPKSKKEHYVDGAKLFSEMVEYKRLLKEHKKLGTGTTIKIPETIGLAVLQIAQRLSMKSNFALYTYRDEMISDAVENCLQYLDNFDPEKSKNPFAYFTQISYYAFLRRIVREKKQTYVKMKAFKELDVKGEFSHWVKKNADDMEITEDPYKSYFKISENDIKYFEGKTKKKKEKKSKKTPLDECMGE